jgi:hypothetical protein
MSNNLSIDTMQLNNPQTNIKHISRDWEQICINLYCPDLIPHLLGQASRLELKEHAYL